MQFCIYINAILYITGLEAPVEDFKNDFRFINVTSGIKWVKERPGGIYSIYHIVLN